MCVCVCVCVSMFSNSPTCWSRNYHFHVLSKSYIFLCARVYIISSHYMISMHFIYILYVQCILL